MRQSTKKLVKSLQLKKHRREEQCFVVEGAKSVVELMASDFKTRLVLGTQAFLRAHEKQLAARQIAFEEATEDELEAAGSLQTNSAAIAVAEMKQNVAPVLKTDHYAIALDDIRDPGNVGTIVRTADWYGITTVIASPETADFYNAKTISATMGSFTRVHFYYTELAAYLKNAGTVYGAFLEGTDVHAVKFSPGGIIVIGNESNGISADVEKVISQRVTIPRYGKAESLNAGLSAAIILDNLRRSQK